jgi:hypothetical protein
MTDTNQMYKRLVKRLSNTRKTLFEICKEYDIDLEEVDIDVLQTYIDQCSHCNIWSTKLVPDLDDNPICPLCVRLVGM